MLTEEQKNKTIASIESHPLKKEALSWSYCVSDIFIHSKEMLNRAKISEEEKAKLDEALSDTEEVVIVVYHTAQEKPEPLSGHGKTYNFVIHPVSNELVWAGTGTWRS
jgi:hypothetical protein